MTLWAITREQDPDLAMLGMTCRVVEGVNNARAVPVRSFSGAAGWLMWMPMLVFEIALALVLIIKGVAAPAAARPAIHRPSTVS